MNLEKEFDYTDILDFLKVDKKYEVYYNLGNLNNKRIEVRAIIDNEVVVYRILRTNNYRMENLHYFKMLYEGGNLEKI